MPELSDNLSDYKWDGEKWVKMNEGEKANLGLASTEELFRELIARFTIHTGAIGHITRMDNAVTLAEMLGGLDAQDKEYRTVGSL